MYRAASRTCPSALRAVRPTVSSGSRRLLSTAPTKKGTWKGTAFRWGLAAYAVYFYNTSPIFADEVPPLAGPAPSPFSDADLPTVDALIEKKRREGAVAASKPKPAPKAPTAPATPQEKNDVAPPAEPTDELAASAEALEQEAGQEGAFNPETGEINWDCPCLGGMAHGPCGENFRAAFSCFIFSEEEPKGMDCIEKFQGMQDCFREYPEIYAAEIADDEEPTFDSPPADESLPKEEAPKAESPAPVTEAVKETKAAVKEAPKARSSEDVAQLPAPVTEAVNETKAAVDMTKAAVKATKTAAEEKVVEVKAKVEAKLEALSNKKTADEKVVELKEKVEAKLEAFPNKIHDATSANQGKQGKK